ncbi:MAG: hypothetical protein IPJ76_14835 [Flavobacteriales bacterium]|nr:MAG: hypothetical protein IPJ76_14835 [Flavobacteriales bacterium]
MKNELMIGACALQLGAMAQPDFDRNYCGFAPNDSIDLTNDGIPDLVVQGFRSGTDDEPSSSGSCHLHVMNLPGTTLLNARDERGTWRAKVCAQGDRIPALSTRPQDDFQIPELLYTDGHVQVAYWGYGHQSALPTVTPGLAAQRYVFRTLSNGKLWHGSFAIDRSNSTGQVVIRVGLLVPADEAFVVR